MTSIDKTTQQVISFLSSVYERTILSIDRLDNIVSYAMQHVETIQSISSRRKNEIVIRAVINFIQSRTDITIDETTLNYLSTHILPSTIEIAVAASKGKIAINQIKKVSKFCCW